LRDLNLLMMEEDFGAESQSYRFTA
jgi:hypothetical protein